MKITLHTLGNVFDITQSVDLSTIGMHRTLDKTLNTAQFSTISVSSGAWGSNIDLSRPIPKLSLVEIEDFTGLHQFYVSSDTLDKKNSNNYKHHLQLIELKWLLSKRPLPDLGIKQSTFNSSFETLTTEISNITRFFAPMIRNILITYDVPFTINQPSNNPDVINTRVLQIGTYDIDFSITLLNEIDMEASLTDAYIVMFLNGQEIERVSYANLKSLWHLVVPITKKIDVTTPNSEITVKIEGRSNYYGEYQSGVRVSMGYLKISNKQVTLETPETRTAEYVVDKIISTYNIGKTEYLVDTLTRQRLRKIEWYNDRFIQLNQLQALEKVGDYIRARLNVYIYEGVRTIEYLFYDDMLLNDFKEIYSDIQSTESNLENYNSGLIAKGDNVLRDEATNPFGGWTSLRALSESTSQLTTENIGIIFPNGIDIFHKVEISGIEWKSQSGNTIVGVNGVVDITSQIKEKAHYDTLDKMSDYTFEGRLSDNQNNCLYYVRGDNKIYGMGDVGTQLEKRLGTAANRALYEAGMAVIQREYGVDMKRYHDQTQAADRAIKFRITYKPMGKSNTLVLKNDQSGFEENIVDYFNAESTVNDSFILGNHARLLVNSMGNQQKTITARVDTLRDLPVLGTQKDGYIVMSITTAHSSNSVRASITMVKDVVFISNYIGIKKDRSLYEIPKTGIVDRIDRSFRVVKLSKTPFSYSESGFSVETLFFPLAYTIGFSPTTVLLDFDDRKITKTLEVSSIANTIEFKWQMEDNYSAGNKKFIYDNKSFQTGVRYTDVFGRVNVVRMRAYNQSVPKDKTDEYPEGHLLDTTWTPFLDRTYRVRKDSNEKLSMSEQYAIISDDKDITVYNALAKYNNYRQDKDWKIEKAVLYYIPGKEDIFIDYGRIKYININTGLSDKITQVVPIENQDGLGVVWYEKNSGEILLTVLQDLSENRTINVYFSLQTF